MYNVNKSNCYIINTFNYIFIHVFYGSFFLELIYCGSVLEDDMTLEFYGIKSGAMVHVLRKREPEMMSLPKYISEDSILQLASTFKSFKENPKLRSALNVYYLLCYIHIL